MAGHETLSISDGMAPLLLRDQKRALHAYESVNEVPSEARRDYAIAVNDLGANILRCGLAAALATVERRKNPHGRLLLDHLAGSGVPELIGIQGKELAARVRGLDVDGYLLVTREMLQVATWLKRATQAIFD